MSTFLVTLGVVAVAIGVLRIALSDPDQPATLRRDAGGGRRGVRHRPAPSPPAPASAPTPPVTDAAPVAGRESDWVSPAPPVAPPVDPPATRTGPVLAPARRRARGVSGTWLRLRSGLALLILVVFVGVVVAAMIGAGLAFAARALTDAIG